MTTSSKNKIYSQVLESYWCACLSNNSVFKNHKDIQREWNYNIIISDLNRVKPITGLTPEQITIQIKSTPGLEQWIKSSKPEFTFLLNPPRNAAYLKRKYKLENFPNYKK